MPHLNASKVLSHLLYHFSILLHKYRHRHELISLSHMLNPPSILLYNYYHLIKPRYQFHLASRFFNSLYKLLHSLMLLPYNIINSHYFHFIRNLLSFRIRRLMYQNFIMVIVIVAIIMICY